MCGICSHALHLREDALTILAEILVSLAIGCVFLLALRWSDRFDRG